MMPAKEALPWVRGLLMILIPIFAILLSGTFIAIADPLTSLVLRNAPAFTFVVAACLLTFHLYVVGDAFAGKLRGYAGLRGRRAVEYMALALVCTMAAAVLFQPALMGRPRTKRGWVVRREASVAGALPAPPRVPARILRARPALAEMHDSHRAPRDERHN